MHNEDDLLQKKLADLENGIPLEDVLRDLPGEDEDLISLIQLVASVQQVEHPEPIADQVSQQRQQVLTAAAANTRPIARPVPRPAPVPTPRPLPPPQRERTLWNWLTPAALFGAAGMAALLLIFILVGTGLFLTNRNMDTARVESITGQVQVAANSTGTEWKNISTGYRLHQGQQVRTLGASGATLVFYEGTHTFLSANSAVQFTRLNGSLGRAIQVEMLQMAGQTWNKVTPLQGRQSAFLVRTPAGTASVHGTIFEVKVGKNGQTQFSVNAGEVRVSNDAAEVTLLAGQITTADPAGEIAAPNYVFDVQGTLTATTADNQWTVSGITFQVLEGMTVITGQPDLGRSLKVSGTVNDNGDYIAQSVEVITASDQTASFTGTIDSQEGSSWLVNSTSIYVSDGSDGYPATQLDQGLSTGDPVRVTINVLQDGTWLAEKIESLVENTAEPGDAPTPTATADPRAMPGYEFEPGEIEVHSCGRSDLTIPGTLRNSAGAAKDYAANVVLQYLIDQGGDYVSSVELVPDRWTRIDAGQAVTFTARVKMNSDWASAPEGTLVKLRVSIASATNRPDHLDGRLTITISSGCDQAASPAPTQTPTVTPTGTITDEPSTAPTAAAPAAEDEQCTGAASHPTGMKLAQRYGVADEEIMNWFCNGHYGFGDIDLAYSLSRQSDKSVEEIFALRAQGLGWGEIKKQVLNGQKLDKDTQYQPEIDVDGDGDLDASDDVDRNGFINDHDKKMWKDKQDKKDKKGK